MGEEPCDFCKRPLGPGEEPWTATHRGLILGTATPTAAMGWRFHAACYPAAKPQLKKGLAGSGNAASWMEWDPRDPEVETRADAAFWQEMDQAPRAVAAAGARTWAYVRAYGPGLAVLAILLIFLIDIVVKQGWI